MRHILFIRFPHWSLQRMLVAQPELQSKAVVLYAQDSRRKDRVVTCSRQAAQSGVRPGMPLQELQALHRSQPSPWHIAAIDPRNDQEQLQVLAAWCRMFTPLVGIEPPTRSNSLPPGTQHSRTPHSGTAMRGAKTPAGIVLDITGSSHLWGGPQRLADTVLQRVQQMGYRCRIAVAPQLGAAWALAYADPRTMQEPLVLLQKSALQVALGELPLAALGIPSAMVQTLSELGLTQWKQLSALPRQALKTRFGKELLERWDQAWGTRTETWEIVPVLPEWEVRQDLEYGTTRRDVLEELLRQLSQRLCQKLRANRQGVLQLACHLRSVAARQVLLDIHLYAPTVHAQHLTDLIKLQFEQVKLAECIDSIRLSAIQTSFLEEQQLRLWSEWDVQESARQMSPLIDRLSNRLGRDRVLRVSCRAEAQPEHACQLRPWLDPIPKKQRTNRDRSRSTFWSPLQRPMYLLKTPRALDMHVSPQGQPERFDYQQIGFTVRRCWGPERIETGWWRHPMIRRDYYRVETETGDRFWIFQSQLGKPVAANTGWYLHGVFG